MLFSRTNIISTSQDAPMYVYAQSNVTNNAGGGAGQSVTTAVAFPISAAFSSGFPTPNFGSQRSTFPGLPRGCDGENSKRFQCGSDAVTGDQYACCRYL
jgi:hypothetical protein